MTAITEVETDRLAIYRQQVSDEAAEKSVRGKMSEPALAKLRAIKEQEKYDAIDAERFRNGLRSVVVNPENLKKLIERCNTSIAPTQIECRVRRLTWWIDAGYLLGREIDSVGLINFFSCLTDGDWKDADARKRRESRLSRGLVSTSDAEPSYRPCKSGKKCLRFEKRKPAPAKGTGEYCSSACAASNKARQKRVLTALASDQIVH
jgi:hypothetical protein